jgi:putative ABC transport system permease protein
MRLPDLAVAIRNLLRRPAFAITSVLLLALAAGANAAVFSIVRGVLLKPLPFHEPERLVALWPNAFVSNEDLGYWRDRTHGFQSIAGISPGWMMAFVADGLEPLKVTGGRTSDNFFTTLGVPAALGRTLLPGDAQPGRTAVAVISFALYERHFSRDPRVIGRSVKIDGRPHEIVGVMRPGFEFVEPGTDVWAPLPFDPSSRQHGAPFSQALARLRPGVPVEAATRELQSLLPSMRADLKKPSEWGHDVRAVPLRDVVIGDLRATLVILLAAVGLVLLLAAVNLGTLALGRAIERMREMAIRTALGASRLRLVRLLIAEQAVVSAAGAAAGLLLARAALPFLVSRLPPELPRQGDIALDGAVFAVVFAVTVLVSILLAFAPIAVTLRRELQPLLRQHRTTETPARRRVLGALVVAQVALAIVLGIGAGLMLRTLWNLQQVDSGFNPQQVLAFRLQTSSKYSDLTTGMPYFEQVIERIRALPGVTHVGSIQHLPMSGYNWTARLRPAERPLAPGATPQTAIWRFIGWEYFATMQIPLAAGRTFTADDRASSPLVAIVNEAYARREYGDAMAALGRRVATVTGRGEESVEIVGVIRDVRFMSLDKPAIAEIYRPLTQTFMFPMAFVVRATGDAGQLAAAVRRAAFTVDPTVPVAELQPLTALIAGSVARPRLLGLLLSVFAASGLALAVLGVYGVVAYRVRQREREFGIRLALGGGPGRLARSVLGQGTGYAVAGFAVGLPAAFALARLMHSVVFEITTHDALTFTVVPAVIAAATLAACVFPARRAGRVDPMTALRGD